MTLTAEQAKAKRAEKAAYTAHVNIIMVQDGLAKPDALFLAYSEGADGFSKRLAGPVQGDMLTGKSGVTSQSKPNA